MPARGVREHGRAHEHLVLFAKHSCKGVNEQHHIRLLHYCYLGRVTDSRRVRAVSTLASYASQAIFEVYQPTLESRHMSQRLTTDISRSRLWRCGSWRARSHAGQGHQLEANMRDLLVRELLRPSYPLSLNFHITFTGELGTLSTDHSTCNPPARWISVLYSLVRTTSQTNPALLFNAVDLNPKSLAEKHETLLQSVCQIVIYDLNLQR
ncbi:hypothetical protein V8C44DRAFT_296909 [Trichoderma aethiopicum]